METHRCCICSQIAGDVTGDLIHEKLGALEYERRVLESGHGFSTIPSLGALVDGHVLLCPNRHVRSFAELQDDEFENANQATHELESTLWRLWGQPVHLFEHGNSSSGDRIVCSVEHAHLHFVPTHVPIWAHVRERLVWVSLDSEPLAAIVEGREYLRYRQPDGQWWIAVTDELPIPSQLMRRVFAIALRRDDLWNWRDHPDTARLERTWHCLLAS